MQVAALVDDSMGLQAYMRIDALRRLLREGDGRDRCRADARPGADRTASIER